MKSLLFISLLTLSACTTNTKVIDGSKFLISQAEDNGVRDWGKITPQSERGFLEIKKANICDTTNKVQGGYFVKLQPPKKTQSKSQYADYMAAERFRVKECSKLALSCSTHSTIWCRQDDLECLKNETRKESNCKYFLSDEDFDKYDGLNLITDSSGSTGSTGDILSCANTKSNYTSQLYYTTHTNKAWKTKKKFWKRFCRQYKTEDQCDEILTAKGPKAPYLQQSQMPFSKWIIDVLTEDNLKVQKTKDGYLWTNITLDVSNACKLMEGRAGK